MNLKELLERGTVKQSDLLKKSSKWESVNDLTGEPETIKFDVFIVPQSNLSFAAHQKIMLPDSKTADLGQWACAISERLRFGDEGEEKMTVDQAANLAPELGWALVNVLLDYNKEIKEKKEAKQLSQAKSSGTSSSSTESVEEQSPKQKKT